MWEQRQGGDVYVGVAGGGVAGGVGGIEGGGVCGSEAQVGVRIESLSACVWDGSSTDMPGCSWVCLRGAGETGTGSGVRIRNHYSKNRITSRQDVWRGARTATAILQPPPLPPPPPPPPPPQRKPVQHRHGGGGRWRGNLCDKCAPSPLPLPPPECSPRAGSGRYSV